MNKMSKIQEIPEIPDIKEYMDIFDKHSLSEEIIMKRKIATIARETARKCLKTFDFTYFSIISDEVPDRTKYCIVGSSKYQLKNNSCIDYDKYNTLIKNICKSKEISDNYTFYLYDTYVFDNCHYKYIYNMRFTIKEQQTSVEKNSVFEGQKSDNPVEKPNNVVPDKPVETQIEKNTDETSIKTPMESEKKQIEEIVKSLINELFKQKMIKQIVETDDEYDKVEN